MGGGAARNWAWFWFFGTVFGRFWRVGLARDFGRFWRFERGLVFGLVFPGAGFSFLREFGRGFLILMAK